jgi:hypothetical protein
MSASTLRSDLGDRCDLWVMAQRNPRRAYDANGAEIPPMTIGNMREWGVERVIAFAAQSSSYQL